MEPSELKNDLRACPRYPVDVRVKICFTKDGFLQRANVKALDIGRNGISVSSPLALPQNEPVELEILLPGTRTPIRVKSVIRNRKGVRYGVEFLSMTDAQKQEIAKFGDSRKSAGSVGSGPSSLPVVN